jgi:hypothetical protein
MPERKVTLTVEVYGVVTDNDLDLVVDQINNIGYVSSIRIENEEECQTN